MSSPCSSSSSRRCTIVLTAQGPERPDGARHARRRPGDGCLPAHRRTDRGLVQLDRPPGDARGRDDHRRALHRCSSRRARPRACAATSRSRSRSSRRATSARRAATTTPASGTATRAVGAATCSRRRATVFVRRSSSCGATPTRAAAPRTSRTHPSRGCSAADPVVAASKYDTFFLKGKVPLWNQMGHGKWATDPTYAGKVLTVYQRMLTFASHALVTRTVQLMKTGVPMGICCASSLIGVVRQTHASVRSRLADGARRVGPVERDPGVAAVERCVRVRVAVEREGERPVRAVRGEDVGHVVRARRRRRAAAPRSPRVRSSPCRCRASTRARDSRGSRGSRRCPG